MAETPDQMFTDFMKKVGQNNFYKKAITAQSKRIDPKLKDLIKLTPRYIEHQRQHFMTKMKD